jgi:cell division protein FtsL
MAATIRAATANPRPTRVGGASTGRAATARATPLRPVPPRQPASRGKVMWITSFSIIGLFIVLLSVTAFQTRIAQNQLELDRFDDRIVEQRERFTRLRLERAALLSPDRLMAEAAALGMEPGGATQFVTITPEVMAQVAVAASGVPRRSREQRVDPLGEYGAVKALMDGVNDVNDVNDMAGAG